MSSPTPATHYRTVSVDGLKLFYREAGNPNAPVVLLLHGFPTSSHMYRNLIPQLADRYHVIAPDLPALVFRMHDRGTSISTRSIISRRRSRPLRSRYISTNTPSKCSTTVHR